MFDGFAKSVIAGEIKNLADEDSRISAIRMLKTFGKAAVPQLVDVLGDSSRNAYAAIILSDIGEAAIPALLEVLSDASKSTYASVALMEMTKKKGNTKKVIIPSLIDKLVDKQKQAAAYAALEMFDASELVPFIPNLVNLLGNSDAGVFAAKLLVGIGKPVAESVTKAVSDEKKQEWATYILQELSKKDKTIQVPAVTRKSEPSPPVVKIDKTSQAPKVNKKTEPAQPVSQPEKMVQVPKDTSKKSEPAQVRVYYCTNCGAKVRETDKFCRECGAAQQS